MPVVTASQSTFDIAATRGSVFSPQGYTVATLPSPAANIPQGARAFVTDASSPTFLGTLTGGSTTICPVFFNGTAWVAG